jgi:xanthine dehydrogenase accessory factor
VNGLVVGVRGGGDLGSGAALRLWRSGFQVFILEIERPIAVRRTVALSEAVFDRSVVVEEMRGTLASNTAHAREIMRSGDVAVLVDRNASSLVDLRPQALVDAILAKRNTGTTRDMARLVVGLGPGFTAGSDVDAVVETRRGPWLGRVYWTGMAEADTGEPGEVQGRGASRVLRAPVDGELTARGAIGDLVQEGQVVAQVEDVPVTAPFSGLLRGLARDGVRVRTGMKIGDVDPRPDPELCRLVSDKSLAVAGGVMESVLTHLRQNEA